MPVWRGYLDLVLDPNTAKPISNAGTGSVHPSLAAAINSEISTAELRLIVRPASMNLKKIVVLSDGTGNAA